MNSTTGKLEVIKRSENQYGIKHHPSIEDWDSCYFEVSGFFGTHKPELFAAAPEIHEALEELYKAITDIRGIDMDAYAGRQLRIADAALAKARGETI